MRLLLTFAFLPFFALGQTKNDNTISVKGVGFIEVANKVLDFGYIVAKIDSNLNTINTEFKEGKGKNKWMQLKLNIRVKDSTAIITGQWVNSLFLGSKLLGREQTLENSVSKIEYTIGNPKHLFLEMAEFAQSFNKPITYSNK